jgi:hypothetical protein
MAVYEVETENGVYEVETDEKSQRPDFIGDAVKQTPMGMAASGAYSLAQGIGKAFDVTGLPVPEGVSRGAQRLLQPARSIGVGVARNERNRFTGESPANLTAPYNPESVVDRTGAMVGENAAVVGASMISPAVGGPLAMMAQQAQGGKVSPLPLAAPAFVGGKKILGKAQKKLVPPLLKSTKGIPEEASSMVIENPEIWNRAGTSESVQQQSQNIIEGIKGAGKKVGDDFGAAYKQAGMNSPVDEIMSGRPEYQSTYRTRNYKGSDTVVPGKEFELENVNTLMPEERPGGPLTRPLTKQTYQTQDEIVPGGRESVSEVSGTRPVPYQDKEFNALRDEFQSAVRGDLFRVQDAGGGVGELGATDKLQKLTSLKRALQNKAIYPPAGQELAPSESVHNAAIQRMAGQIDELRGTVPGGENLALADDAWSEMESIRENLWRAFKDPYTGQDYLNRIMKGNMDWLTAGRNAGRVGAIQRVEQITGKELLKPALEEMAAAYMKNPRMMGLPSTRLMAVINSLVPARFLTNPVPKRILSATPRFISGSLAGGQSVQPRGDERSNSPKYTKENNNQNGYGRNLQGKNNQATPRKLLKSKPEKILTPEKAKEYLKQAKGDRNLARRLAKADDWTIPE